MTVQQATFEIVAQDKTQSAFSSVKRGLGSLENAFGGMKAAIASVIGTIGIGAMIRSSLELGDQVRALSTRLGASTEALSQYRYAAKLSNIEFETLVKTWEKMQRNIALAAMGTGPAKEFLKKLGVDAKEFVNLRPEDQFERLADSLMKIQNPSERAAYAFAIMGKSGVQMLQMMENGSVGMRALREEADRLGLTITREMADKMDQANDQLDRVKMAFAGLGTILAVQLAPAILKIGEAFLGVVQFIRQHQETLAALATTVAAGGALIIGLRTLSIVVSATEIAFNGASRAVAAFLVAFSASPVAALSTSLSGVSVAAVAASGALGKLKVAAGVLFAAFAGWEIGSWLQENFAQARVAGLAFIGALLQGWENLKFAAQAAWLAISSGWGIAVDAMKVKFAEFLQFVASGLSNVPFMQGATDSLSKYANELKIGSTASSDFSASLSDLTQKHRAAKAEIDNNITGLVAFELGIGKAKTATVQHAQQVQYADMALGSMGKQAATVNKTLDEGKRLTQEMRTPMEIYQDNINKLNQLLDKGSISQETYNRALQKYKKDLEDSNGVSSSLEKQKSAYEQQAQDLTGIFKNGFFALMDEGFDGMVKSFTNALKTMAAEAASAELGKLFFGSTGGSSKSSGAGDLFGSIFSGIGSFFGLGDFGGFRAGGGNVQMGKAYVVGENEPELFTPTTNGFITPLSKMTSNNGSTIVINNNIQTADAESFRRSEGNLTARMKMQLDRASRRNL